MFRGMQGAGRMIAVSPPQLFRNTNVNSWRMRLPSRRRRPIIAWLLAFLPSAGERLDR